MTEYKSNKLILSKISKKFKNDQSKIYLDELLYAFTRKSVAYDDNILNSKESWILKNINFTIEQGDSLALLGKNGTGKSTLLKIISGSCLPTNGRVIRPKKVGSLISLGNNLSKKLTGLENIDLILTLRGNKGQNKKNLIKKIVEFSELDSNINKQIEFYSSGMNLRLAFSIEVFTELNLLLIDEALAVGDQDFQLKSYSKILELKKEGVGLIVVSHSINSLWGICDKGVIIHDGVNSEVDKLEKTYQRYQKILLTSKKELKTIDKKTINVDLIQNNNKTRFLSSEDKIDIKIQFTLNKEIKYGSLRLVIMNDQGNNLIVLDTYERSLELLHFPNGLNLYVFNIQNLPLRQGRYRVDVSVIDKLLPFHALLEKDIINFSIVQDENSFPYADDTSSVKCDFDFGKIKL